MFSCSLFGYRGKWNDVIWWSSDNDGIPRKNNKHTK